MVAREAAPYGITVNAIAPGPTKTPTRQILIDNEKEIAKTAAYHCRQNRGLTHGWKTNERTTEKYG